MGKTITPYLLHCNKFFSIVRDLQVTSIISSYSFFFLLSIHSFFYYIFIIFFISFFYYIFIIFFIFYISYIKIYKYLASLFVNHEIRIP